MIKMAVEMHRVVFKSNPRISPSVCMCRIFNVEFIMYFDVEEEFGRYWDLDRETVVSKILTHIMTFNVRREKI